MAGFGLASGFHAAATAASPAHPESGRITRLSEHLAVLHDHINVGIIQNGKRAMLIDCTAEPLFDALPRLGIQSIERVLFTHHHRDQACGADRLAALGARLGVPKSEQSLFSDPALYWSDDRNHWRVYRSFRPDHLTLAEPLRVDEAYIGGDQINFGPAAVKVIETPGHTDGAVSYLVEVDGRRVVFCGDCIYDEGRVWDLFSLQKGFAEGGRQIGGYHGFMGDRWGLVEILDKIKSVAPDSLVPSHGVIIQRPAQAVDTLAKRLEACYENYVAVSALRHYYPELFIDYAGRPGQMPIRPGIEPPPCLCHFGTTWMLVSKSGAAFVMDIGSQTALKKIKDMLAAGDINGVEGLWVTHYHYDHTDGIFAFQDEFDCPCITDRRLAEVLTNPAAWRLPCLAVEPMKIHRPTEDGESWNWREFKMTSFHFPGQTLYHSALLVESAGLRMFFVGDSHTMSGIDDYCAHNRNWLGRDVGFQRCLSLIEKLKPTHIFNCHVERAFTFTPDEIRFMRGNLDERERLLGELAPWRHANYATDPFWVRCFPYQQRVRPGEVVALRVVVTNHSSTVEPASCRLSLPKGLGGETSTWVSGKAPAKTEFELELSFRVPGGTRNGRHVVPVDVRLGTWNLPRFTEALVDV